MAWKRYKRESWLVLLAVFPGIIAGGAGLAAGRMLGTF